jgi:hypothetical protein
MSSAAYHNQRPDRRSQSRSRVDGRRIVAWLLLVLVLLAVLVPVALFVHAQGLLGSNAPSFLTQPRSAPAEPADRFMQSVVTDDGALGWHQLCPSIQAQLPMDELVQQADAQRAAAQQQGVRLTVQFKGAHPRQGGGAQRVYVVTAHWPNGTTQTRTFTVMTQSSGCVEDVQN